MVIICVIDLVAVCIDTRYKRTPVELANYLRGKPSSGRSSRRAPLPWISTAYFPPFSQRRL